MLSAESVGNSVLADDLLPIVQEGKALTCMKSAENYVDMFPITAKAYRSKYKHKKKSWRVLKKVLSFVMFRFREDWYNYLLRV